VAEKVEERAFDVKVYGHGTRMRSSDTATCTC